MLDVSVLSALDAVGIRTVRVDSTTRLHSCPACGAPAKTKTSYSKCSSALCGSAVMTSLDIIRMATGGRAGAAASSLAKFLRRQPFEPEAIKHEVVRRAVLDSWITIVRGGLSLRASITASGYKKNGLNVESENPNITILDPRQVSGLCRLAEQSGGSFDPMLTTLTSPVVGWIVQTAPHTIDRVVLRVEKSNKSIRFNAKSKGICGLLSASPELIIARNWRSALESVDHFRHAGIHDNIGFFCVSKRHSDFTTAQAELPTTLKLIYSDVTDLIPMANAMKDLGIDEGAQQVMKINSLYHTTSQKPGRWEDLCKSTIRDSLKGEWSTLPQDALFLIENLSSGQQMILDLAEELRLLGKTDQSRRLVAAASHRTIYVDEQLRVIARTGEYAVETKFGSNQVANFSLDFDANLVFRDTRTVFHQGRMIIGTAVIPFVLPPSSLRSVGLLEESLRHQTLSRPFSKAETLPTIFDQHTFRKIVTPHLTQVASSQPPTMGADHIGWTVDRSVFIAPGCVVSLNGREAKPTPFHPTTPVCGLFEQADIPEVVPKITCGPTSDATARILAMCLRFYVNATQAPLLFKNDQHTRTTLRIIFRVLGQVKELEINQNLRDIMANTGVRGYPLLAVSQGGALTSIKQNIVILTDQGLELPEIEEGEAEAIGRALLFGLLRIAEWCLSTSGEEFREAQAMTYEQALLIEGKWLLEHVCEIQGWEIELESVGEIERFFAGVSVEKRHQHFQLINGLELRINTLDAKVDYNQIKHDFKRMGIEARPCPSSSKALRIPATMGLPIYQRYFGQEMADSIAVVEE